MTHKLFLLARAAEDYGDRQTEPRPGQWSRIRTASLIPLRKFLRSRSRKRIRTKYIWLFFKRIADASSKARTAEFRFKRSILPRSRNSEFLTFLSTSRVL